jgi:hypothetical protein
MEGLRHFGRMHERDGIGHQIRCSAVGNRRRLAASLPVGRLVFAIPLKMRRAESL